MIHFTVPGLPIAQPRQRHRVVMSRGRAFTRNYTPKKDPVNDFKEAVRLMASQAANGCPPLEGPIVVIIFFLFPRPERLLWKRKPMLRCPHIVKPDLDNLEKAVMDALTGILYLDDSQVCLKYTQKYYVAGGETPSAEVLVREWENDED